LKFSDVILAVATAVVIYVLVTVVLVLPFIPLMGSFLGLQFGGCLSLLVATLIAGWILAGKIQEESRIRAIGKIAVLLAVVDMFVVLAVFSGNSYYWAWIKQLLQGMFSTGAWTTTDWYVYEMWAVLVDVALNVITMLVLGSIGLYIGSMLRKQKKS
jgi:hypothetical protein